MTDQPICKHGYTGPHHRINGEECTGPWRASSVLNPLSHPVPVLGVGTRLEGFFANPGPEQQRERQTVAFILDALAACGFVPYSADGERVSDTKSALEVVFNLDECHVHMMKQGGGEVGHLYFVRGNEPEEVLCDYGWKRAQEDEPRGFKACTDAISRCAYDCKAFDPAAPLEVA